MCHVSLIFWLCDDILYENLSQILAVAIALLIAGSTLFLEHEHLIVFQVLQDLTLYRGAFYCRCTYLNLTVVVYKQDFVEAHGRINLTLKTVNIELTTLLSLELLTCDLYYNVHLLKN